jgi:hypothetical protein
VLALEPLPPIMPPPELPFAPPPELLLGPPFLFIAPPLLGVVPEMLAEHEHPTVVDNAIAHIQSATATVCGFRLIAAPFVAKFVPTRCGFESRHFASRDLLGERGPWELPQHAAGTVLWVRTLHLHADCSSTGGAANALDHHRHSSHSLASRFQLPHRWRSDSPAASDRTRRARIQLDIRSPRIDTVIFSSSWSRPTVSGHRRPQGE